MSTPGHGNSPDPFDGENYCPACERSYPASVSVCAIDGSRLISLDSRDPLIGVTLDGRYRIDAQLGSGGMGAVYLGEQISVGRSVAIKVIHTRLGSSREMSRRFLREAKFSSRLNHPNSVGVIDFGRTSDGILFLVMELVTGRTLAEVLKQEGRMTPSRAVGIMIQICGALEAAHDQGIVHRDLKPANVMIVDSPDGDLAKVLDFGIAKSLNSEETTQLTQTDAVVGTPTYLSPEAVRGIPTDGRSDLYTVGLILYELLEGRPPFADHVARASNPEAPTAPAKVAGPEPLLAIRGLALKLAYCHAEVEPPPLPRDIPKPVCDVVMKLLRKQPARRYQTAGELRAALAGLDVFAKGRSRVVGGPTSIAEVGAARTASLPISGDDSTLRAKSAPVVVEAIEPDDSATRIEVSAVSFDTPTTHEAPPGLPVPPAEDDELDTPTTHRSAPIADGFGTSSVPPNTVGDVAFDTPTRHQAPPEFFSTATVRSGQRTAPRVAEPQPMARLRRWLIPFTSAGLIVGLAIAGYVGLGRSQAPAERAATPVPADGVLGEVPPPRAVPAGGDQPARTADEQPVDLAVAAQPATDEATRPGSANPAADPSDAAMVAAAPPPLEGDAAAARTAPASVQLRLDARPVAEVLVDGVSLGKTPQVYRTPVRTKPVVVEFRRSGYVTVRDSIAPTRNRDVVVTLSRERRKAVPTRSRQLKPAGDRSIDPF